MDSADHADDEMRSMELVGKYREQLIVQAKATMRVRPGERIAGLILDRSLPVAQTVLAALPATQQSTTPEVVGIVPRAWAAEFVAQFNPAAADWLPSDDRDGDQCQLPVVIALREGLQMCAQKFAT